MCVCVFFVLKMDCTIARYPPTKQQCACVYLWVYLMMIVIVKRKYTHTHFFYAKHFFFIWKFYYKFFRASKALHFFGHFIFLPTLENVVSSPKHLRQFFSSSSSMLPFHFEIHDVIYMLMLSGHCSMDVPWNWFNQIF